MKVPKEGFSMTIIYKLQNYSNKMFYRKEILFNN